MFKDISDVIDKGFNAVVLNGKLYEIQGGFKDSLLVGPPNEDVSFEIRLSEVGYLQSWINLDKRIKDVRLNAIMKDGGCMKYPANRTNLAVCTARIAQQKQIT